MRAKDEFRNIAETYNTKLLLERVVDGKLMCPEACCGSPVLECKCGEDCPHCNCFMIQKAIKSNGLTDKLLKEYYEVEDDDYNPVLNAAARSIIGTTVTLSNGHTGKVVDVDVQSGYMVVKTADGNTFKAELGDDDIKYEDAEDIFPNSEYGRSLRRDAKQHEQEDKEDKEAKALEKELGGGRFDGPWKTYNSGSPRVRLTRDSPGTASVHLPEGDPRIQKYLDHGYKIVKDYKKATQSEDNEVHLRGTNFAAEPPPVDEEVRLGNTWNDRFKRLKP